MSTLMEELTAIKAVEDKLTANKVANFAYTNHAYENPLTEADGVSVYDVESEQNIPVANASILNVNPTILTKGWRAQASSITRMLMNHFLGRCSYNLNKVNDLFSDFLGKLMFFMGKPDGLALLDSTGRLPQAVGSEKMFMSKRYLSTLYGIQQVKCWVRAKGDNTSFTMSRPVFANGLWVCGSTEHGMWYSEDNGDHWVQGTGDNTEYTMGSPVYANGLWVAGSTSYGLWWSEDGKSWTRAEDLTEGYFTSGTMQYVTYANGLWVCGSIEKGAWWSEDGKSWTQGTGSNTGYTMQYFLYANNLWVAGSVEHGAWWSEDGKSWTQGTGNNTGYTMQEVMYVNDTWIFGSKNGIWYGESGKSWLTGTGTSTEFYNIIHIEKSTWGAIGKDTNGYSVVYISVNNGTGWYSPFITGSGSQHFGMGYLRYANGVCVVGSTKTVIQYISSYLYYNLQAPYNRQQNDWSLCTAVGFSNTTKVTNIMYANGVWLGIIYLNYGYRPVYSIDGVVWLYANVTKGTDNYYSFGNQGVEDIVYDNGIWLANVANGGIYRSQSIEELIEDKVIDLPNIPLVD